MSARLLSTELGGGSKDGLGVERSGLSMISSDWEGGRGQQCSLCSYCVTCVFGMLQCQASTGMCMYTMCVCVCV